MSLHSVLRRAIAVIEGDGFRRHRDLLDELRRELDRLEMRQVVRSRAFERRAAVEGEKFVWKEGSTDIELEVRPKTPGDEGRWWCVSCGVVCEHQLDRDLHCQEPGKRGFPKRRLRLELGDVRARHVLAWRNFCSGTVEVP